METYTNCYVENNLTAQAHNNCVNQKCDCVTTLPIITLSSFPQQVGLSDHLDRECKATGLPLHTRRKKPSAMPEILDLRMRMTVPADLVSLVSGLQ